MKISPLAVTQPNWEVYIKMVEETLGFSPTVGLGKTFIKMDSPVAYLATLDFENRPLQHLRQGYLLNTFEHFSISFICSLDADLVSLLITHFPKLSYLVKKGESEWLLIITATMTEWHQAIRRGLRVSQIKKLREFYHNLYALFVFLGFQEVWSEIEKNQGADGFTVMGPKYEKD